MGVPRIPGILESGIPEKKKKSGIPRDSWDSTKRKWRILQGFYEKKWRIPFGILAANWAYVRLCSNPKFNKWKETSIGPLLDILRISLRGINPVEGPINLYGSFCIKFKRDFILNNLVLHVLFEEKS